MKAFEFFNDFGTTIFIDECKYIWDYLSNYGKLNIPKRMLYSYYCQFSQEYDKSLDNINIEDEWLDKFAEWLSKKEI